MSIKTYVFNYERIRFLWLKIITNEQANKGESTALTNKKHLSKKISALVINICGFLPPVITFFAMKSFIKISAEYSKKTE